MKPPRKPPRIGLASLSARLIFPMVSSVAIALSGCGGTPACSGGDEHAAVLTTFTFARQMPKGVSRGFDLDNHVSGPGDDLTCNHADLLDPDGKPGIDNALSGLLPAIDAVANGALDGIIQGAVNNGMLLVGIDLKNVESLTNDDCVEMTFSHLSGVPTVGTDKLLDNWQTFDTARDIPESHVTGRIDNGVITAGPFELALPVRILDAKFTLHAHHAYVRSTVDGDGNMSGIFGGGIEVQELLDQVETLNIGANLQKVLPGLLMNTADLAKNPDTGDCMQLSTVMVFTAKPAFINP